MNNVYVSSILALCRSEIFQNSLILFGLVWLSYWESMYGMYCIDDMDGVANYDGKPQWKLDKDNKNYAPCNFHTILRWIRWHSAKIPNPNKNWKKDKQPEFASYPKAHHRLNFWITAGSAVLLYLFLYQLFGSTLAFLTTALFIVHPLGAQAVAWISGIGYCLSLFFMLIGLNATLLTQGWCNSPAGWVASLTLTGLFQYLAIQAQFAQMGVAAVYLLLGLWPQAILSAILALTVCRPVLQDAVTLRVKVFNDQQMGASTKFHFRKFIVAVKSLYYYTRMALFPKRLGLYHTFGYHYELPYIETEDKYLFYGVLTLIGWGLLFLFGSPIIQFGVIWYLSILFLFLNWITIHQFVSERYNWIPTIGICLIVSQILSAHNLVWLWCVLFGIALMRTWAHLPTYFNEIQFYQSNVWNFPQSEVAVGNLGVAYTRVGMAGAAHDMWMVGTRINPEYDVNWYNLYSVMKGNNQIEIAQQHLAKALSCRTCHFPKDWIREVNDVTNLVDRMKRPPSGFTRPFQLGIPV